MRGQRQVEQRVGLRRLAEAQLIVVEPRCLRRVPGWDADRCARACPAPTCGADTGSSSGVTTAGKSGWKLLKKGAPTAGATAGAATLNTEKKVVFGKG